MLVGAKIDLEDDQREVPREHGIEVAEKNFMSSFGEISSKTGKNVNKTFEVLTELTLEKIENR